MIDLDLVKKRTYSRERHMLYSMDTFFEASLCRHTHTHTHSQHSHSLKLYFLLCPFCRRQDEGRGCKVPAEAAGAFTRASVGTTTAPTTSASRLKLCSRAFIMSSQDRCASPLQWDPTSSGYDLAAYPELEENFCGNPNAACFGHCISWIGIPTPQQQLRWLSGA